MSVKRASRTRGEIKRWRQARNGDLLKEDVEVNDSITVSSARELTSVSMHYSQGNGVHTPLSRLVLYPRSVCLFVLVVVCVWSTHSTAMCCRGR